MSDYLEFTGGYMYRIYDFPRIERDAREALEGVEFDTLVGTGLSGSVVIPRLADAFGVKWLLIRKENDGSHSGLTAEGRLGRRWLFVDDFCCTGATYKRVLHAVDGLVARGRSYWTPEQNIVRERWECSHVGIYAYMYDGFMPIGDEKQVVYSKGHGDY